MRFKLLMMSILLWCTCIQVHAGDTERNGVKTSSVTTRPLSKEAIQHYNAGVELHRNSHIDEAILEYQASLKIDDRLQPAYSNLGGIFAAQGKYAEAKKTLEAGLALKPDHALTLNNYGKVLYSLGNLREAVKIWRRVVDLDSSITTAPIDLATALDELGRHGEAIAVVKKFGLASSIGEPSKTQVGRKAATRVWTENNGGMWVEKFRPQEFYPQYENLVRDYAKGRPILGPGSKVDELLSDRSHRAYVARDHIGNISEMLSSASGWSCISKEKLLDGLVQVREGRAWVPKVSSKFVKDVKEGLRAYPRSCVAMLAKSGCKINLAPLVTNVERDLVGVHPTGYDEDSTYANVGGVFTDSIVIGEYKFRGQFMVAGSRYGRAVQHEVGHALDRFLGYPSNSVEFIGCYEDDRKNMSGSTREQRQYFLQERGGPAEIFAELLACKYGDSRDDTFESLPLEFPKCYALINKLFPPVEASERVHAK